MENRPVSWTYLPPPRTHTHVQDCFRRSYIPKTHMQMGIRNVAEMKNEDANLAREARREKQATEKSKSTAVERVKCYYYCKTRSSSCCDHTVWRRIAFRRCVVVLRTREARSSHPLGGGESHLRTVDPQGRIPLRRAAFCFLPAK